MRSDRRIFAWISYIVLGAILIVLGVMEIVDAFWSGMGSALIAIGIIRAVHFFRFRKDETYREKYELEMTDERNRFLRNKAWAWAGYIFVITLGIAVIVFKVIGQDLLSYAASIAVCFMLCLFWISYYILPRKY